MSKPNLVPADQLMSHSDLFTMGAVLIILTLLAGVALYVPTALFISVLFEGTALDAILQTLGPVCVLIGVPSFLLWRDRHRIANNRRALWVGLGTASGFIVAGGLPACATAASAGYLIESILFPLGFGAVGFLWTMFCWLLVRLRLGAVQIVTGTHCHECGYSLTGNQSGICLECGQTISATAMANANH